MIVQFKVTAQTVSFPSGFLSRSSKMIKEWKWVKGEMDNEVRMKEWGTTS